MTFSHSLRWITLFLVVATLSRVRVSVQPHGEIKVQELVLLPPTDKYLIKINDYIVLSGAPLTPQGGKGCPGWNVSCYQPLA